MINKSEVLVVVTSVGERTESVCIALLAEEVPQKNIVLLNNKVSFQEKLKESFQTAIDRKSVWMLRIDADVLVKKGAIDEILKFAAESAPNTFEVHTKMLDKFSGGVRPGGAKLYRSSLLQKAIDLIPAKEVSYRPETFVLKEMEKLGYPWIQTEVVVGLHDYEQFYKDIHRHTITNTIRGAEFIDFWKRYWKNHEEEDFDFKLALFASSEAEKYKNSNVLDVNSYYEKDLAEFLQKNNVKEKIPLDMKALNQSSISEIVENFKPEKEYYEFIEFIDSRYGQKGKERSAINKLIKNIKNVWKKKI
jgi:hypothetical protein